MPSHPEQRDMLYILWKTVSFLKEYLWKTPVIFKKSPGRESESREK